MLSTGERTALLSSTQAVFEDREISRVHISKQKTGSLTIRTSISAEVDSALMARLLSGQGLHLWKLA